MRKAPPRASSPERSRDFRLWSHRRPVATRRSKRKSIDNPAGKIRLEKVAHSRGDRIYPRKRSRDCDHPDPHAHSHNRAVYRISRDRRVLIPRNWWLDRSSHPFASCYLSLPPLHTGLRIAASPNPTPKAPMELRKPLSRGTETWPRGRQIAALFRSAMPPKESLNFETLPKERRSNRTD